MSFIHSNSELVSYTELFHRYLQSINSRPYGRRSRLFVAVLATKSRLRLHRQCGRAIRPALLRIVGSGCIVADVYCVDYVDSIFFRKFRTVNTQHLHNLNYIYPFYAVSEMQVSDTTTF